MFHCSFCSVPDIILYGTDSINSYLLALASSAPPQTVPSSLGTSSLVHQPRQCTTISVSHKYSASTGIRQDNRYWRAERQVHARGQLIWSFLVGCSPTVPPTTVFQYKIFQLDAPFHIEINWMSGGHLARTANTSPPSSLTTAHNPLPSNPSHFWTPLLSRNH